MKIGPLDNKAAINSANAERKSVAGASTQAARPEPSAKVELSPAASLISKAETDGSFDAQKVDRLAAAIRNGSFQVDADAIADKLIAQAQEMLGRTPQ
jgi:negative regulator of flagellin synthesis FlgM